MLAGSCLLDEGILSSEAHSCILRAMRRLFLLFALGGCASGPPAVDGGNESDLSNSSSSDLTQSPVDLTPLCGAMTCSAGEQCQTSQGCCSCGPFARACLPGWTCAVPTVNDTRCPAVEPNALGFCLLPDGVSCWYCAGSAPHRAMCASAAFWSECQATGAARCWSLAGPTVTCD